MESMTKQSKASSCFKPLAKLSFRSLICLGMTLLLICISITRKGIEIFADDGTFEHLRRDESKCDIPTWTYPNCKPFYDDTDAPPLTPEEWYDLRAKYEQAVGANASSLDPSWRDQDPTHKVDGYHVPVAIRTSPGKGRGVFLTAPVSKGQIIWDNRYSARFPDECSTFKFLEAIGDDAACDIIMWAYVNDFFGQGLQFQVDLDGGAYINEATDVAQVNTVNRFPAELSSPAILNLTLPAFLQRRRKPGTFQLFAKSDLEAGTELLLDYTDVHIPGKLFWYDRLCIMTRGLWNWFVMQ